MTIQIYGNARHAAGDDNAYIEQYFANLEDAAAAWRALLNKYNHPGACGELRAVKTTEDNVRPVYGYGKDICIAAYANQPCFMIGHWSGYCECV